MRLHALVGLMVISISSVTALTASPIGDGSINTPTRGSNHQDEFPGGGPSRPIPTVGATSSTAPTPTSSPSGRVRVGCMFMTPEEFAEYCKSLPR